MSEKKELDLEVHTPDEAEKSAEKEETAAKKSEEDAVDTENDTVESSAVGEDGEEEDKPASQKKSPAESRLSRKAKYRTASMIITVLTLVAVVVVNMVASALTDRFAGLTADITTAGSFRISDQSVKIAEKVGKNVKITFLSTKTDYQSLSDYCRQAVSICEQLSKTSGGLISVEFRDLVKNPMLEKEYPDYTLTTTDVIIRCGEKYNILSKEDMFDFEFYDSSSQYITASMAEQAIDNAIVKVTSNVTTKIAMLTDNNDDDFTYLETVMKANNYEPVEMKIEDKDIPDDIDTVIALAPTKDYSTTACSRIMTFLENSGNFGKNFIYIVQRNNNSTPNIDSLLESFDIKIGDGLAFDLDTEMVLSENMYGPIAAKFGSKLYIEGFSSEDYPVLVALARPILPAKNSTFTSLLRLSDQSGYCGFDVGEDDDWSPYDNITGKISVMAAGSIGTEEKTSIAIASGSSMMWQETYMQSQFSNQGYVLNILADLSGRQDDSIKVENKVITKYDLKVSQSTKTVLGVLLYAVLPVLIVGAGILVFIMRRRR